MTIMVSSSFVLALMSEELGSNRAWVHVIPAGTFSGIDGRGPYRLDDPEGVVAASRAYTGKRKMLVDYEHQSMHARENGKPAPAAGWIVGLQARADGVWALVEWTETASQHIAKREFRYLSPVFQHTRDGKVEMLINVALTNSPNLDQLTALASAEVNMGNEALAAKLKAAAKLIGLPEDADQATIIAKLKEIGTVAAELGAMTGDAGYAPQSAIPDPAKYVPIGEFERVVADANKLRQGVTLTAANSRVESEIATGRLAPFMKDWAIELCTVNMPAFEGFMERVGPAFNQITSQSSARATAPDGAAVKLSDDELAVCSRMGLTAEEYAKAR